MKKNSTDHTVLTPTFRRVCMGGCLLYIAAYLPLPVLFPLLGPNVWSVCLALIGGMFLSGPFNAYLGDTYRRKHVFMVALSGMLIAIGGYAYAESVIHYTILAIIHGACLGLTSAAGVTVSIDITTSGKRTRGNEIYALANRIGMYTGIAIGLWMISEGYSLFYLSMALGLIAILEMTFVYVPFRAPIGVDAINLDRFILPRALVPALNVVLIALTCALALSWAKDTSVWVYVLFSVIPLFFIKPLIRMFVKLSHHCQRGTGNTTFNLAADAGWMTGLALATHLVKGNDLIYAICLSGLSALLIMVTVSWPYYKKKRVR